MSSIQPVHVHFPALLEQPPADRVRKRGLVYPKLAQSKGSGDRMNSPDLFWGSRRVSAAPPGPDPREAVPRGRSIHLPKPAVTLSGILTLCIRYKTRRRTLRCSEFEPRYYYYMDTSAESSTTRSRRRPPPRSGAYRVIRSLGCNWFVGVGGGPLDAMMRGTGSSRCTPAIEEVDDSDGLFGVPSSAHFPHFPSRPISSYSSGTSTSGRDSENSSVVILL